MTASPGLGLEESKNGRKDEQKRESEQCRIKKLLFG
jgi:hypothetical protein